MTDPLLVPFGICVVAAAGCWLTSVITRGRSPDVARWSTPRSPRSTPPPPRSAIKSGSTRTPYSADMATWLGEALRNLNPPGTTPALPIAGTPSQVAIGIGNVQVGSEVVGGSLRIGQFFPLGGVTIPWVRLEAIWHVLR